MLTASSSRFSIGLLDVVFQVDDKRRCQFGPGKEGSTSAYLIGGVVPGTLGAQGVHHRDPLEATIQESDQPPLWGGRLAGIARLLSSGLKASSGFYAAFAAGHGVAALSPGGGSLVRPTKFWHRWPPP